MRTQRAYRESSLVCFRMRVVDLFAGQRILGLNLVSLSLLQKPISAGLGGFTCGALEAGAEPILVVDANPSPLKVLGANAPSATAVVATLGEGHSPRPVHCGAVPQCTCLRRAARAARSVVAPLRA